MNGRWVFFLICVGLGFGGGWWWSAGAPIPDTIRLAMDHLRGSPTAEREDDGIRLGDGTIPAAPPANGQRPASYYDGIMKAMPAVVSVYAGREDTSESDTEQATLLTQGSGVIVGADGIILTNLHLLTGASSITIVLSDGTEYPGLLIGSDTETDLAVVRIPAQSRLPHLALDDAPPLRVGDVVLAIGNPFGVGQTVTQGIVSATQRRIEASNVWQYLVQIDAAINPGNSGGALVNSLGQLVGVNTAVLAGDYGGQGISYAIPADLLAEVVPEIIEHGSVSRGFLGTQLNDLVFTDRNGEIGGTIGALVVDVLPDSPAALADIQSRDIVIAMNDKPITSAAELLLDISTEEAGTTVTLTLLRQRDRSNRIDADTRFDRLEISVTLGDRFVLTGYSSQQ